MRSQNSFTLIELLIVIGILAILVAAVVIALNPAQLLAQARDSKRVQDLSSLRSVINTVEALSPSLSFGVSSTVYTSLLDTTTTCANLGLPTITPYVYHCVTSSDTLTKINGTGWIPIDFTQNGVASLSALPLDPINTASSGLYYTYVTGGSFELTALLESQSKHDAAINDGGSLPGVYEIGSNLSLTPPTRDMGLVGYWPFDEGTGTVAYDRSGNGNNGTLMNGPTWTGGKMGGALQLDGVDDQVNVPYSPSINITGNITLSLWVNQNVLKNWMILCGKGFAATAWEFYTDSGGSIFFRVNTDQSGQKSIASGGVSVGRWYHIVGTYNGTHVNLYVNGSSVAVPVAVTGSLVSQNTQFTIGSSGSYWLNGLVDDVRIYNRALSASEISALYSAMK